MRGLVLGLIAVMTALIFSFSARAQDSDGDLVDDATELGLGSNHLNPQITPRAVDLFQQVASSGSAVGAEPEVVWTGSEYGLAWYDFRGDYPDLYFRRLSASGGTVGSELRVTTAASSSVYQTLAWTGSEYALAWVDDRDGDNEIYYARVSAAGVKVGSDVRVTTSAGDCSSPELAWTGTELGLSWQDDRNNPGSYEIYFARVSTDGVPIGSEVRITSAGGARSHPAVSWAAGEYGLVWQDARDGNDEIYFARVSAAGVKVGGDLRITSNPALSNYPALVFTGSEYIVSWEDFRDSNTEIYFTRLAADGSKISPDSRLTQMTGGSSRPALAWNGMEVGASWHDSRMGNNEIFFTGITPPGLKIGLDHRITLLNYCVNSDLAWSGSEFGVAWERSVSGDIYFTRVSFDRDGDGLVYAEELAWGCQFGDWDSDNDAMDDGWEADHNGCGLSPTAGDSTGDGDGDLLSNLYDYTYDLDPCNPDTDGDGLTDSDELNLHLTDPLNPDSDGDQTKDGVEVRFGSRPLDPLVHPQAVEIGDDVLVTGGNWPSLAWTGSEFGISLTDGDSLRFTRLSPAGDKIGSDVELAEGGYENNLVWTGSEFGLFSDAGYFNRLSAEGVKLGAPLNVGGVGDFQGRPSTSLAWTGSQFGAVRQDSTGLQLHMTRIAVDGTLVGNTRIDSNNLHSIKPSLAWSGSEYGLAWLEETATAYERTVFIHVSTSGAKSGFSWLSDGEEDGGYSLCWGGSQWGLAWNHIIGFLSSPGPPTFARLSVSGPKIGADKTVSATMTYFTPLRWNGNVFGLAADGVRFYLLDDFGETAGNELRITAAGEVFPYSLSWTGSEFGIAWANGGNIFFSRIAVDYDGDGVAEAEESAAGSNPKDWDSDNDGLSDGQEVNVYSTSPIKADTDGDGLSDPDEIFTYFTSPVDWDSDGDRLPDGYEVLHGSSLDPLNALDAAADPDGDGNPTGHEYYNESDPWAPDPVPAPGYEVGCYYWGNADGIPFISPTDIVIMQKIYVGIPVDLSILIPPDVGPLDISRNTALDPADIQNAQYMYVGANRPAGYPSTPSALSVVDAPSGAVAVGDTAHVTVSVHAQGPGTELFSPGMGVVFWVESGNAALLGGEGTVPGEPAGNRYDISMRSADGAPANIVVLVTGAGPVVINAKVPACGIEPKGRWCGEVGLAAAVVVNP